MYCTNCGKQVEENALFCSNCGARCVAPPQKKPLPVAPAIQPTVESPATDKPESKADTASITANIQEADTPAIPSPEINASTSFIMQPSPSTAAAPTSASPAPEAKKKKRMPKWLLITLICVGSALLLTLGVLALIEAVEQAAAGISEALGEDAFPAEEEATPTKAPKEEPALAGDDVEVAEGELLYLGHGACSGIDNITLSFVLSADKTYIHDVTIAVTGLSGSANGVTVNVSNMTERHMGEFDVDYFNENTDIELGHSKLLLLMFDDTYAGAALDYVFFSSGVGPNTQSFEIPFGEIWFDLDVQGSEPVSTEEPEPTPTPAPVVKYFDTDLLKNWDSRAMQEAFGAESVEEFRPENPKYPYYIVCAEGGVYDPVTHEESEGGYNSFTARHLPISTETMLRICGTVKDSGLILTDDPQEAMFALVLDFSYTNNIGTFRFSEDGSKIKQYNATLTAELVNLVTGERIQSEEKKEFATYTGESVRTSMLNDAKGKQLYSSAPSLYVADFEGFQAFLEEAMEIQASLS
ncbi:MAG: zinc ribbon domain-containing protein [Eubacteriales bacterium]|nr:zinc ribbon domain-containing protein [Eubacteriales bacterium]